MPPRPKPNQNLAAAQGVTLVADVAVTPAPVAPGSTATLDVTLTSSVSVLRLVYVEIRTAGGSAMYPEEHRAQSLVAGQPLTLSVRWAVPAGVLSGPYVAVPGVATPD